MARTARSNHGNACSHFQGFQSDCGIQRSGIRGFLSEANSDIYFAKVDIDQNPDLASAAKVQAVPTLMVIKNQQIVFQQAGALRASDLDDLIAQAKALDVNAAAAEEAEAQAE